MHIEQSADICQKVANMLSVAGADHIITMDLHASQIQVFVLIVAVVTVVVVTVVVVILVICVCVDCWSC